MRATSAFLILVLGSSSFNTYSNKYTHNISDDVKIDYHQDGLVKIYSIDKGQQIHYFSLKLKSLSNKKHHSILEAPLSVSQVDNSIVYIWDENISDKWELVDSNLVRQLTIKTKPSIDDSNEKLIINSYFKTDLGFVAAGMSYPYTFSRAIGDYNKAKNNLRVDETSFYIADSNCKQLILDKDIDYNKKLDYIFETKNIEYPITLTQEIKINNVLIYDNSKYEREVAVYGNNLAISGQSQSYVKLYEKDNDKWKYVQTLYPNIASDMEYKGTFGTKIALSKDTIAIASYDELDCKDCKQDAVYLFKKNNGQWMQQARLTSPDAKYNSHFSYFGNSLDLYEDKLVVADVTADVGRKHHKYFLSKNDKDRNRDSNGAVYFFQETNNEWKHIETILPTEDNIDFGKSVALDNSILIIGGTHNSIDDKERDYGQFYVYHFKNNNWYKQSQIRITDLIKKNVYYDSTFADSIDVSNNTIVVGNPLSSSIGIRGYNIHGDTNSWEIIDPNIDQTGEVYVFKKKGNKWTKQIRLQAPNPLQLDHFGQSVKIINDTLVIGAYGDSSNSIGINGANDNCQLPSSGAVYVYEKKWNGWKQNSYIKSDKPEKMELFGQKIDFDGETIIVNSNDVYIFNKTDNSWKKVNRIKTDQIKHSK